MTLAGIAGFILSIGMAVDANVLIFARMKDELRTWRALNERGRSRIRPRLAVDSRLEYLNDDHERDPLLVRSIHWRQHHHWIRSHPLRRRFGEHVHRNYRHQNLPQIAHFSGLGQPSALVWS